MTAPTYAALIRVSHMGARKADAADFHSGDDQESDCARGLPAGARLKVLPPELDVSGGLPLERRPSLLAAVEGVERGEYAGIIVAYLSRLGRSVREQLRAWDRVEAAGGRIIVVREGIDTSTASGRLHRGILMNIDEHYRESAAEGFDHRRSAATEAGIWQRRQKPRGYDRDPETRRLIPNADARLVLSVFERRANGATHGELADLLGYTTTGASQLLRNRVYLGELRVGQYVNPAAHPAIVTEELFEAVQRLRSVRPARAHSEPALLTGLVRCASCGHSMPRRSSSIGYGCHGRHGGGAVCPGPASISCARLNAYVESIVRPMYEQATITASSDGDASSEREALTRAKAELAAYTAATSVLDVGQDAFSEGSRLRAEAVEMAQETLHARLATMPATFTKGPWEDLSVTDRNAWLRTFLSAVVVRKSGRGIILPVDERVRVLRLRGARVLPLRGRGGAPTGLHPIRFGDMNSEDVVRPLAA